jgi:hypothetical protein
MSEALLEEAQALFHEVQRLRHWHIRIVLALPPAARQLRPRNRHQAAVVTLFQLYQNPGVVPHRAAGALPIMDIKAQ